ncbi:beta-glucosidase [Dysgonomonas hofstadii]|uniref:beta-glucosidase n=1 Tax=Dysgonomonas hofstadii TaxID=637886 RepID=A0A840CQD3_9BACT|nr:glycoside hydrolase family 3 N-terminal domain-containing protein [Dysgonomonas hofstadii]MBB4037251.1 beta-glucosidase [Dysgonomonas hofstadii]
MKYIYILFTLLFPLMLSCNEDKNLYKDAGQPVDKRVENLLAQMTLEEKVGQMSQYVGLQHMKDAMSKASPEELKSGHAQAFYPDYSPAKIEEMTKQGLIGSFLHVVTAEEANYLQSLALQGRLQIPVIIGIDAVHGNGLVRGSTIYPTCIGQASTFNPALVEQMSKETALEMRATGSHWTFTPNLEIARDARWGRVGETFGEDTYLVSAMGVATIKGLQGGDFSGIDNVIACAKHFVGGSQPVNGINGAPFDASERTLREIFLPPFKAAIDAGVATVMTAHNEVDGIPAHGSKYLMEDLLRKEMKFQGFIVSDWLDVKRMHDYHKVAETLNDAFFLSVDAGMDMNMHGPDFYFGVLQLVKDGKISKERIDEAVRKILKVKFQLGLFERPYADEKAAEQVVFSTAHQQTALEVARQSVVLLKNENKILPLDSKKYKNILVTGPNANNQTILGDWTFEQPEENVTTIYEGLQKIRPDVNFSLCEFDWNIRKMDPKQVDKAVAMAKSNDLAIIVVGENSMRYHWNEKTCGENSDRYDLNLFGLQQELVERIHKTGMPTVVVLVNGRPLTTEWIADNIPALIEAWEPGSLGGQAVAEIIFGDVNPSGKLAVTIPRHSGQIQTYYNHKFTSKWFRYATGNSAPLYEFGYGLSYSDFKFEDVKLSKNEINKTEPVELTVKVTNAGEMAGDEVVQLYITDEFSSATRPVKELKDFQRISLQPGEIKEVKFTITPEKLSYYDAQMKYGIETGEFTIRVGSSSRNNDLINTQLTVK